MFLLFEYLSLVVVRLRILIILIQQLLKVNQTLLEVFQLVKKNSSFVHALVATPRVHRNRLVVRLQSAFEVADSLHRICLSDVARAIIGLKINDVLEIYQCFLEFLQVNMNLTASLVCFHILGELLNTPRQL